MIATINYNKKEYQIDLSQPIDISIPLHTGSDCVSAWYVQPMKLEPVKMGDWVGDVNHGAGVNFRNIFFNPHGNGTHTECVGHISKEFITINQCLKNFWFIAELISVQPEEKNGDQIITKKSIDQKLNGKKIPEALILRTLPNRPDKIKKQYSNTNPPYLEKEAMQLIKELNIEHFLIDLPSVDKEKDDGELAAHHIFWQYPENPQLHKTITELIYAPENIADGTYFLNLQIASFENDASPSKPVLYKFI